MKVICAPDKFKESLSAPQVALAMKRGIMQVCPDAEVDLCPIADGGEGFLDTLHAALGGQFQTSVVTGPRGQSTQARWLSLPELQDEPRTAAIEMAQASGLQLLAPDRRDPMHTTTFGTGELIACAIREGHTRILIGIGGSATTDGGTGMAAALGAQFFDAVGELITGPPTGAMLPRIHHIDLTRMRALLKDIHIIAACDVTNPLTGSDGAAHVYGPQKGATMESVLTLDRGLVHLAQLCRAQLETDHEHMPGSGAAGGLGFGLVTFANAKLKPGIDLVLEVVQFDRRVQSCDLCLTGEGKLDAQSLAGKACMGVAGIASRYRIPAIALVGISEVDLPQAQQAGLSSYHVIGHGLSREQSMQQAASLIESAAARVMQTHLASM